MCALSVSMKSASPDDGDAAIESAGRVARPAPWCADAGNARSRGPCRHRARSTSLALETYMMPSTTIGVFSTCWTLGTAKTHLGARRATLRLIDLRQLGVAVAAGIAVIRGPVGLRSHFAIAIVGRLAQQMNALSAVHICRSFMPSLSTRPSSVLAVGGLDLLANLGRRIAARHRDQSAHVSGERGHIRSRQIESRHAARGAAGAQERGQLGLRARVNLIDDVGSAFAAGGIAAMAVRAACFKLLSSRQPLGACASASPARDVNASEKTRVRIVFARYQV